MNVIKTFLCRIGHILLGLVRGLRKAVCCRRKKEAEYLLPMTINHVNVAEDPKWEEWPETKSPALAVNNEAKENVSEKMFEAEESGPDDFFKDMVPQIRKPKKLYIQIDDRKFEEKQSPSNRLAMDPKAILTGPDLGVIDDSPSNWEEDENSEDFWDSNRFIKESKRAEREKRLAEHQRRKLEKQRSRASKSDALNSIAALSLSDSKDKPKYS